MYIGNTDGTMYVFGAKSGKLLWARPLGSYIYGAAAVYKRKVFVGTYDGKFYALDAATGDVRWQIDAHGAVHAAPTVMSGLVYYAVCSSCGSEAQRSVARGPDATYAVRARDGHPVWRFPAGKYANPVVADEERIYLTGRAGQYAFAQAGSEVVKDVPASSSAVEKSAKTRSVTVAQNVERGERVALDLKRVVEAGQLEHLERGVVRQLALAPGRVVRAAHEQRRERAAGRARPRSRAGSAAA